MKLVDFSANFDFSPAKIPRNRPIFPRICPWKSREILLFFPRNIRSPDMFRSVLIFAVVFWTYNVCMFWLFVINCWNTVLFNLTISGNNAFSTMCNVSRKPVKLVYRCTNTWDIWTRFGCYLYSTEWSWIINHDTNEFSFLANERRVDHQNYEGKFLCQLQKMNLLLTEVWYNLKGEDGKLLLMEDT